MTSDILQIKVLKNDFSVLVIRGELIEKHIAHMGLFVINTRSKLQEAVRDYPNG